MRETAHRSFESLVPLQEMRCEAAVGRLTRSFVHQLANDLAMVQTALDLIGMRPTDPPEKALQVAQKAIDEASWLLHRLRLIAHHERTGPCRTDPGPVVEEVFQLVDRAHQARLAVRLELAPELPVMAIHPNALREALLILLTDSIQDFQRRHAQSGGATLRAVVSGRRARAEGAGPVTLLLELGFHPGRGATREQLASARPLESRRVELCDTPASEQG
ncbi:MAG: hypothetical protein P1V51_07645 [Deltaproteobacteria bacterium]|nr:hypothetical protein [Deltaproteobacteria bacterium]